MIATLYYLFGSTEGYSSVPGLITGLIVFLIGIMITLYTYSIKLVDKKLDKNPTKKIDFLRIIIVAGCVLSILFSIFISFLINRYNFCFTNKELCDKDYKFSILS
jgi:hypothetical protein